MVGIYSLFILGVALAGPAYIWLTFIPLIGMLFVALVFGEFASHYPVAGALYQYSKFSSVLRTVGSSAGSTASPCSSPSRQSIPARSATSGALPQLVRGELDPTNHTTILIVTLALLAIQTTLNITGTR